MVVLSVILTIAGVKVFTVISSAMIFFPAVIVRTVFLVILDSEAFVVSNLTASVVVWPSMIVLSAVIASFFTVDNETAIVVSSLEKSAGAVVVLNNGQASQQEQLFVTAKVSFNSRIRMTNPVIRPYEKIFEAT